MASIDNMDNVWQDSQLSYRAYTSPTMLPKLHPDRADKLHMYALAALYKLKIEHVLTNYSPNNISAEVTYLSYEWRQMHTNAPAYVTFRVKRVEGLCYRYMSLVGMSNDAWLAERFNTTLEQLAAKGIINAHNPAVRADEAVDALEASTVKAGVLAGLEL
jgi:hypothetical protein